MRLISVLMMLLCCPISNAQSIAIENIGLRDAYPGLENRLNIVVERVACDQIYVKTNNGEIKAQGNCQFIYLPAKIGRGILSIFKIHNGDTLNLGTEAIRIRKWPLPKAYLGGSIESGKVSLALLKVHGGILAPINSFDICGNIMPKSFKMRIFRQGEQIALKLNHGAAFEISTKSLIGTIRAGDFVIFEDIQVLMPGESIESTLESIYLEII